MSSTHSSAPGSYGRKKNSTTWMKITTSTCRVVSEDQPRLKPGVIVSQTTRLTSKTFLNSHRKCLTTASKTSTSPTNSSKSFKQTIAESTLYLEHIFAQAIERQIRSGFPFDVDQCLDFVDGLEHRKEQIENKLKELFPPIEHKEVFIPKVNNTKRGYIKGQPFEKIHVEEFNPGSRQQIVDRLKKKYNWIPQATTEKGNPILNDDVLEKLPYPEAKPLSEYMLLNKRLGQIKDGKTLGLSWSHPMVIFTVTSLLMAVSLVVVAIAIQIRDKFQLFILLMERMSFSFPCS